MRRNIYVFVSMHKHNETLVVSLLKNKLPCLVHVTFESGFYKSEQFGEHVDAALTMLNFGMG